MQEARNKNKEQNYLETQLGNTITLFVNNMIANLFLKVEKE